MNLRVLYEDNHCLAVDKPAGLLTQGDATGDRSLVDLVRDDLKRRYAKPGNVYVGLLHRLDRPVSGVVLLAKTSKAAGRLSAQFREGAVEKIYLAIVEGRVPTDRGEWTDQLLKDPKSNRVETVRSGGQEARVTYQVVRRSRETTTVELSPHTGRSHQLRVQLASRGLPIVGDRKYGAKSRLAAADGGARIALHAARLSFTHPTTGARIAVESPAPADWVASG